MYDMKPYTMTAAAFRPSTRLATIVAFSLASLYAFSTLVSFRVRVHQPQLNPFRATFESMTHTVTPSTQEEKLKDLQILWSKRNPNGFYNLVDDGGMKPDFYNPTFIELPPTAQHQYMVLGRLKHTKETFKKQEYRFSRLIAFYADIKADGIHNPALSRAGEWNYTFLDNVYEPSQEKCKKYNYFGSEDVKVWWTSDGVPMLMFSHMYPVGDPRECWSMFMIDARAAVPELSEALGEYGKRLPKIEIHEPRRVHREEAQEVEKNWAPFQPPVGPDAGDIFFSVDLEGKRVYRFENTKSLVSLVEEEGVPSAADESNNPQTEANPERNACLHDLVDKDNYWQIHQGTPVMSMTLCRRGECTPDVHNTVLLGVVQGKYKEPINWYEPRVVTYNVTAPFHMRSISKRLSYHGAKTREFIYTMHMMYWWDLQNKPAPKNRAHGYIDDEIWLAFGVDDSASGFIDLDARELVRDHHYCQGATSDFRIEG